MKHSVLGFLVAGTLVVFAGLIISRTSFGVSLRGDLMGGGSSSPSFMEAAPSVMPATQSDPSAMYSSESMSQQTLAAPTDTQMNPEDAYPIPDSIMVQEDDSTDTYEGTDDSGNLDIAAGAGGSTTCTQAQVKRTVKKEKKYIITVSVGGGYTFSNLGDKAKKMAKSQLDADVEEACNDAEAAPVCPASKGCVGVAYSAKIQNKRFNDVKILMEKPVDGRSAKTYTVLASGGGCELTRQCKNK